MGRNPKVGSKIEDPFDRDLKDLTNNSLLKARDALERLRQKTPKINRAKNIQDLDKELSEWVSSEEENMEKKDLQKTYECPPGSFTTHYANVLGGLPPGQFTYQVYPTTEDSNFPVNTNGMNTYSVADPEQTVFVDRDEMDEDWFGEEDNWFDEEDTIEDTVNTQTRKIQTQVLDLDVEEIRIWGMKVDQHRGKFYFNKVIPFFFSTAFIFWWLFIFAAMWMSYKFFNIDVAFANFLKVVLGI